MERKLASVEDMKYYMHVMPNLFKAWSRKSGWQLVAMRFNLSSSDQDDFKLLEKAFSSFGFDVEEINQTGVDKMVEKIKGAVMKLTESQLRRLIREEYAHRFHRGGAKSLVLEARSTWSHEPKVGENYVVGYRRHTWNSKFLGWDLNSSREPIMRWKDLPDDPTAGEDGMEWEAYIFEGRVVVGSSADPLIIHRKL